MKNKVLYILFYIISLFPLWYLYILSDILYLFAYKIYGYRKEIVYNNLSKSFPNKNNNEIIEIQDKFYRHFFDIIIESVKSISAKKDFFKKRVRFKNKEIFNKYNDLEKSVILAVSHYGNWEWGILGISINTNQKIVGVYKEINTKFFDNLMMKIRSKFGAKLIEMNQTPRYIIENKGKCMIIGLLADQSPTKNESNYWEIFLNQETPVYTGPEKISKKMNYPVIFCSMNKIKRGKYEVLIEELCINPLNTNDGEITSLYLQKIEDKIKEKPEYWLWTHRRWKHTK